VALAPLRLLLSLVLTVCASIQAHRAQACCAAWIKSLAKSPANLAAAKVDHASFRTRRPVMPMKKAIGLVLVAT
jgi:hypothetical protein